MCHHWGLGWYLGVAAHSGDASSQARSCSPYWCTASYLHLRRRSLQITGLKGYETSSQWASYQIRKIAGCACAGNTGNVFPATDISGNYRLAIPACITARASRALMHFGIAHLRWRGKRFRHSQRMRNPQFYISAKRPMSKHRRLDGIDRESRRYVGTVWHWLGRHIINQTSVLLGNIDAKTDIKWIFIPLLHEDCDLCASAVRLHTHKMARSPLEAQRLSWSF